LAWFSVTFSRMFFQDACGQFGLDVDGGLISVSICSNSDDLCEVAKLVSNQLAACFIEAENATLAAAIPS